MPQVKFDKIDDEDVVTCTSKGWYLTPNVTWLDRGERDLSNHSTVEVLEEQMNGLYRVYSVLKYPVKLNEKYTCHITETNENNKPIRSIRRYPSKCSSAGKRESRLRSPRRSLHSLIFTECQMWRPLLSTLGILRSARRSEMVVTWSLPGLEKDCAWGKGVTALARQR